MAHWKASRFLQKLQESSKTRTRAVGAALCIAATVGGGSWADTRLDGAISASSHSMRMFNFPYHAVTTMDRHMLQTKEVKSYNSNKNWLLSRRKLQHEYEVEGVIGEGGYGLVHVGRHRSSNAPVAIKRVSKQRTTREKFLQEVNILTQLGGQHNVLELREAFETTDAYVLVTELVTGGELYDNLVECGVFDEPKAQQVFRELTSALCYLHSKNVVHADIKPENILLNFEKDKSTMRLIDFGQSFHTTEAVERHRSVGSGVGTTAYASPEFLDMRESGCAIDIWALGVVLYIMLCGQHPFDPTNDASDEELKRRILAGEVDYESAGWQCVSATARDLIQRMLVVNPAERISAEEVLQHEWLKETIVHA